MINRRSIETELKTVRKMVEIYCRGNHQTKTGNCEDCENLLEYAKERLERCPHEVKPKCSECKIHCYKPDMRKKIREVMVYSGKRMVFHHPILALKHFKK
ncbi:MAG: nitrous oxide-stimulated promoter family protein [Syntrophorhabdaceae bacterium]|nr:nitrous oxide-stimulated promoter family protein [Syntrophorhabdaceae bacterium]